MFQLKTNKPYRFFRDLKTNIDCHELKTRASMNQQSTENEHEKRLNLNESHFHSTNLCTF